MGQHIITSCVEHIGANPRASKAFEVWTQSKINSAPKKLLVEWKGSPQGRYILVSFFSSEIKFIDKILYEINKT